MAGHWSDYTNNLLEVAIMVGPDILVCNPRNILLTFLLQVAPPIATRDNYS